jgi:hypothetical protein
MQNTKSNSTDNQIAPGQSLEVPSTNNGIFKWLFAVTGLRKLIAVGNAFLNMEIYFQTDNGATIAPTMTKATVVISNGKAIVTSPVLSSGTGTSTPISLAAYSTVENCTVGMIRYVAPTSASSTTQGGTTIPGTYFCILANPATQPGNINVPPKHPQQNGGMNAYWFCISTWSNTVGGCDVNGNPITLFSDSQLSHA